MPNENDVPRDGAQPSPMKSRGVFATLLNLFNGIRAAGDKLNPWTQYTEAELAAPEVSVAGVSLTLLPCSPGLEHKWCVDVTTAPGLEECCWCFVSRVAPSAGE
jgi:hypothetical protein